MNLPEDLREYINIDGAVEQLGEKDFYKMILMSFLENDDIDSLTKYIEEDNYEEARKISHGIKGVAANLSLVKLESIAGDLEKNLYKNKLDNINLEEFREIWDKTKEYIKLAVDYMS